MGWVWEGKPTPRGTHPPPPPLVARALKSHDPNHYRTAFEIMQAVEAGHITQDQGSARLRELGKARR